MRGIVCVCVCVNNWELAVFMLVTSYSVTFLKGEEDNKERQHDDRNTILSEEHLLMP